MMQVLDPNLRVQFDPDARTLEVRASALSAFLDCERRFYWEYVRAIEPDYPPGQRPWQSVDTGSAVHAGIAAYYDPEFPNADPCQAVLDWAIDHGFDPLNPDVRQGLDLAIIMVEGHISDVESDGVDTAEETLWCEKQLSATLDIDGWKATVHGKPDRLIRSKVTGEIILEDTKTAQHLDSSLGHITQLGRYAVLLRLAGEPYPNIVRTNQIKKVKRTKDGPFYSRPWLPFNQDAYDQHFDDLVETLRRMIDRLSKDQRMIPHVTTECSWKCRVQDLCIAQSHGDDYEAIVEINYRPKEGE